MPIGSRSPGRATGPNIGPRNVTGAPLSDLPDLAGSALAHHLVPIDHQSVAIQGVADAAGVATLQLEGVASGLALRVERISVTSDSAAVSTCTIYVGAAGVVANRIDWTPEGNDDIADMASPIFVPGGQALVLQWTDATAGAICTARVQYQLCTFVDVPVALLVGRA